MLDGPAMAAKRGLVSMRSSSMLIGSIASKEEAEIVERQLHHLGHEPRLDGGEGAALDHAPDHCPAPAEQRVDHGVDQAGIDRDHAEILPFAHLEHAEHGGQRHAVHELAEARGGHFLQTARRSRPR